MSQIYSVLHLFLQFDSFLLPLHFELVFPEELDERKSEVRVEGDEQHDQGEEEVVNGRRPNIVVTRTSCQREKMSQNRDICSCLTH